MKEKRKEDKEANNKCPYFLKFNIIQNPYILYRVYEQFLK